jgi:cytochrome c peroxidase
MGGGPTKRSIVLLLVVATAWFCMFARSGTPPQYTAHYLQRIDALRSAENELFQIIASADLSDNAAIARIDSAIARARVKMKAADFWLRYLEPLAYKHINGPLPVEWETEVFEKFEKPYRRTGAGFTLAWQHLHDPAPQRDTLLRLIKHAIAATDIYTHDSITTQLSTYHNFYLCNRLFLLNLAAIYTTGFECPDAGSVIPELSTMLHETALTYTAFAQAFPAQALPAGYCRLFDSMRVFVQDQPMQPDRFDHFTFIRDFVNPLYAINQQLILQHRVISHSLIDYSLNKQATSIFDKRLYNGQNTRGIFLRVEDSATIAAIENVGRSLFFDPILSANGKRACASCHIPRQCFTDTSAPTALHLNTQDRLPRNTPSLVNSQFNHLLMADGSHYTLQQQAVGVITNPAEMGCTRSDIAARVLLCPDYKRAFSKLLDATPAYNTISEDHIISAITTYYSSFSNGYSPFDSAMNRQGTLSPDAREGFNLFMGKAQCGTCHFLPLFNGVKPPYIGSEFEVLGTPADTLYYALSADTGRYGVNPAPEMHRAFRTGTLRNIARTAPYMHNGVFTTLMQVINFYDGGGGAGHGLNVPNQTLSADSLHLSPREKNAIISFLITLNEDLPPVATPASLPHARNKELNTRVPGGIY